MSTSAQFTFAAEFVAFLAAAAGLAMALLRSEVVVRPSTVRPPFRLYSRHAVPAAGALILTNIGHSAIYAFLPLYAIASGLGGNLGWFYALFSAWRNSTAGSSVL